MNIEHLRDKFDLNELELALVKYLEDNQNNLKDITIRQMASANFTSTSAIYRLCNKFGFSGYSDMIYQLSSSNNTQLFSPDDLEQYIPAFIELLNKHRQHNIIVFVHQRRPFQFVRIFCDFSGKIKPAFTAACNDRLRL